MYEADNPQPAEFDTLIAATVVTYILINACKVKMCIQTHFCSIVGMICTPVFRKTHLRKAALSNLKALIQ